VQPVIATSSAAFRSALAELPLSPNARATARAAFLVAPAANELASESARDNRYMQMDAPFDAQRASLAEWGFAIGSVPLDEIEKAGGSLRCCVAEIF